MRELTETEMRAKAEAFCAAAEHCPSEVREKLSRWGADDDAQERILGHLTKEKYIDTARYCKAFVRDKYRFAHWGRIKIAQMLRMRGLAAEDIAAGMEEIDEEEYSLILKDLLRKRQKSITGRNDYERNAKLIRFAAGRGFATSEILRHIKGADDELDC